MDKKAHSCYKLLIAACVFLYASTICIKMVYSSEIVEIVKKYGETNARVGLGLTAYYITYCLTQLALVPLVKKINIGKLMLITLSISSVLYGIIPLSTNVYQLWILLAINGILQATSWGGCMYFLGKYLPPYMIGSACSIMSTGFIGGTILTYLVAPIFVEKGIWQWAFYLFAGIGIVAIIFFVIADRYIEKTISPYKSNAKDEPAKQETKSDEKQLSNNRRTLYFTLGLCSLLSLCVCVTYYTISNWFPTFLNNVFGVKASTAILVTTLLYIFSNIATTFAYMLCERWKKSFANVSRAYGLLAMIPCAIMIFVFDVHVIPAVALGILAISLSRSVSSLICTYLPLKLNNLIDSATTALLLNAFASAGAAIGPAVSGALVDGGGWGNFYLFVLLMFAATALVVIIATHFYKKLKV